MLQYYCLISLRAYHTIA